MSISARAETIPILPAAFPARTVGVPAGGQEKNSLERVTMNIEQLAQAVRHKIPQFQVSKIQPGVSIITEISTVL
jgi:hypothetical protein